jgi:peptidoglycan/LPS O-acetylase OafA/YrhL
MTRLSGLMRRLRDVAAGAAASLSAAEPTRLRTLDRVRPRPTTGGRSAQVDGLRGLAALLVFFHHTLQVPAGGYLGVDLFFVLSGYLITSLLLADIGRHGMPRFARFYLRRAVRLLPAFLCAVGLYLAIRFCFAPEAPPVGPRRLFQLLFLADLFAIGHHPVPFLQHVWSLAVEWQFYFVWPFVLALLMRFGLQRMGVAAVALVGIAGIWALRYRFGVDARVDGLLFGAAMAAIVSHAWVHRMGQYPRAIAAVFWAATGCFLVITFAFDYSTQWMAQWGFFVVPLLGVLMLGGAILAHTAAQRLAFANPVIVHFGRISYGLYLYHYPIAAAMYVHGYSPLKMTVVGILVAIPLAECSWRYLEAPLLQRMAREQNRPLVADSHATSAVV